MEETKKIKVLVTDNEPDFRQLMQFWLESRGYAVLTAPDGESAIQAVKENSPDIIFMDLRMPQMDGAEAIKRIRQFNQDVPIIIISAYLEDLKIKEASGYGISGVFYKGKDFAQGLSLLESALRRHKKLQK